MAGSLFVCESRPWPRREVRCRGASLAPDLVEPGSVHAAGETSEVEQPLFGVPGGIGNAGAACLAAEAASARSALLGEWNTNPFTAGKGGDDVCGRRCLPSSENSGQAMSVPRLSPGTSPIPWHLAQGFQRGARGPSTTSQTASRKAPAQDRCTVPGRARWVSRRSRVPCDGVEGGL